MVEPTHICRPYDEGLLTVLGKIAILVFQRRITSKNKGF